MSTSSNDVLNELRKLPLEHLKLIKENVIVAIEEQEEAYLSGEVISIDGYPVTLLKVHPDLVSPLGQGRVFWMNAGTTTNVFADTPENVARRSGVPLARLRNLISGR